MSPTTLTPVTVPDIGDFADVPVIEILVAEGDTVAPEDPLVTLESDKATMDVPSPAAGVVRSIKVKVDDRVAEGTLILELEPSEASSPASGASDDEDARGASSAVGANLEAEAEAGADTASVESAGAGEAGPGESGAAHATSSVESAGADESGGAVASPSGSATDSRSAPADINGSGSAGAAGGSTSGAGSANGAAGSSNGSGVIYASPSARRLAREMGVDIGALAGSGRLGRVTVEDVRAGAAGGAAQVAGGGGAAIAGLNLGPVERVARSRIQKISAPNMARNWVMIPHVTQHDDADITELEAWRKQLNGEQTDVKYTMVSFLVAAVVATLKAFPDFNASLDGDELVRKGYYNIGFAADTPNGLVVPVIKAADTKGLGEIATDLATLSAKARDGKLGPGDITGATFTISSLGGIGGSYFTPIINAPEVAILGVSRSVMKPVWDGSAFQPRLMVPLSLSYDHRVIDGAAAARFIVHLGTVLSDLRRALL
jgi:pyruvate dehydrogenase E2 component (dihydrolipoamide acetyltransferase)